MIKYIDLSKSAHYNLPFFNEEQAKQNSFLGKGWSYSFVFHFIELKNVFIALKKIRYQNREDFTNRILKSGLPFEKTPWESRRILEQLNALKNFGLITNEYNIQSDFFQEENYTNELTENDLIIFKKIYLEYFRFKEIHSWLLNPIQKDHSLFVNTVNEESLEKNSKPIFPFMIDERFNNAFIFSLENYTDVFRIPNKETDLMRFWDVYVKWGQELQLLEKFNLKNLDYELSNNIKSFACVYYINPEKPNFNLLNFVKSEYQGKNIHIPKLILKIALRYRYRINEIKQMIIEQALADSNTFSLQRTSEIFIRDTEINFVPKYRNSYISHLQLQ
jgi:hypothetical protein